MYSPQKQQVHEWMKNQGTTWTEKRQLSEALNNKLVCFDFVTTVGSSAGVGSDKSCVSEKLSWQLYGG